MPAASREVVKYSAEELQTMSFVEALDVWTPNLANSLPDHIPLERFKRVVITAVSTTPELAYADRRSLFNSCARCAHDGLYPDGKEAALVVFNTKVKKRQRGPDGQWLKNPNGTYIEKEYWAELVTYMPMIAGVRKRMRNTGQVLSAEAEVVYEHDEFRRQHGDDPKIIHVPPPLDQERGRPVGAYAIIRLKNGEILREVMSYAEIEHVRVTYSRGDNPAWKKSRPEMMKKTVMRRCSKAAPSGADLEEIFDRDNEYDEPDQHSPMQEIPPRPDRRDFLTIVEDRDESPTIVDESEPESKPELADPADEPGLLALEVVDLDGEVHQHDTAEHARTTLLVLIEEAKGRGPSAVEGLWESNAETIKEIGEAIEDGAEPLHQAYAAALETFEAKKKAEPPLRTGLDDGPPLPRQQATVPPRARETAQGKGNVRVDPPIQEPLSLEVPIRAIAGQGATDWAGTAEDMRKRIAKLTSPADTASDGRFKRDNRKTLDDMRNADRDAWGTIEYELGQRDLKLRKGLA